MEFTQPIKFIIVPWTNFLKQASSGQLYHMDSTELSKAKLNVIMLNLISSGDFSNVDR